MKIEVPIKIEDIDTRYLDLGAGALRGVLCRLEMRVTAPQEIELAIEHIQRAARTIERLQRQIWKKQLEGQRKRRKPLAAAARRKHP